MVIDELKIENIKGFKGSHKFKFENNLVYFVGNNNTGKSSVFEAIDFLRNGVPRGKTVSEVKTKNANALHPIH